MSSSYKGIQNPVDKDWEQRVKRCDDTEPPRNDEAASRAVGNTYDALSDIFGRHANIQEAIDRGAHAIFFEVCAELGFRGTRVDSRDFNSKRSNFSTKRIGKCAHAI